MEPMRDEEHRASGGGARRAGAAMAVAVLALAMPVAVAQQPPIPSEPIYRDRAPGGWDSQTRRDNRPVLTPQQQRCMQLERELANDWMRGQQGQSQLPQIEQEIAQWDRVYQQSQAQAERSGCYENVFIFGRALVRTPRCLQLHERVEDARRQLARLQQQREATARGGSRYRQDELIRELARYGCGPEYQQEARRRDGGLFGGWFTGQPQFEQPRRESPTSRIVPFATYRTMCVRTCDGYYFPISFSTLPNNFPNDAAQCQARCAAPAELYVYRNPGEEPEQMVSVDGRPYNSLENAWRHRKEFVKGCSCNQAEYDPEEIAKSSQKADAGGTAGDGGATATTGSTATTR